MRLVLVFATVVVCATFVNAATTATDATSATTATAATAATPASVNDSGKLRYDNYKVYKLNIKNKMQLAVLDFLQANSEKYNIWKDYDDATKEIHVMVSTQEVARFLRILKFNKVETKLMINNVQELIDNEENVPSTRTSNEFDWSRYYTLEEIEQWLDHILATYPNVTEGFTIGTSYENRTIRGIKISLREGNPGIFIESNVHAREWITSATATWFINQLLTSSDPDVQNLAENYDWYIIPVFNVDGFVYSHNTNRMWRKNRREVTSSTCLGVDLNRNFDAHWMMNNGASSYPCSETYAGSKPFSEPEAVALANYLSPLKDKIKMYFAFHSYSQVLLSPYGHTGSEFPDNYDDMQDVGEAFCDAIARLPYNTQYISGSTASVLYVATGASVDWVYSNLGTRLSYTIEFRDKGRYGFILPPTQIVPNAEELLAGMIAMVERAKELKYFEN